MGTRRRRLWLRTWAGFVLGVLPPVSAWASEREDARLSEREVQAAALRAEMNELAAEDGWRGVEADYEVLLTVGAQGVSLTSLDHRLGALAAARRGDVAVALRRLRAAREAGFDPESDAIDKDLQERFAPVTIDAPEQEVLVHMGELERPDEIAAVAQARELVASEGAYAGWLPLGTFQVGSQRFVVDGVDLPLVVTTREVPLMRTRQRRGWMVDAGAGMIAMGSTTASGVQPEPQTGLGPRIGVVWNERWTDRRGYGGGASLEAAWQPSVAGQDAQGQPDLPGRMGLMTLHGEVVFGSPPRQLAVGPAWSFGGARARADCAACDFGERGALLTSGVSMLGVQVVGVLAGEDSKTGGQVAVRLQSDGDRAWLSATVGGRMFLTEGR